MPKNMPQPGARKPPHHPQSIEALQRVVAKVSGEMPDVANELRTMKPYQESGWFDRMMYPKGAYAVTMPFSGRMLYDPSSIPDEQTLLDTLTHEGEHVRQMKGMTTMQKVGDILGGMFTPYEERWQEKEARKREQTAHEQRLRGDIRLPSSISAIR